VAEVTLSPTATPEQEVPITEELVAGLLEDQAPEYRGLPLALTASGWDNAMVRLGESLAVRLPRRALAAELAASELDWLPRMSSGWTFAAPIPHFVGEPGRGYPWRWAVVPWLTGSRLLDEPLGPEGAADLGAALAQVHVPAPDDAPLNVVRSLPLAARRERFELRLGRLADAPGWHLDVAAARGALDAADPSLGGTWCHLDLHGNNVLTRGGRLAAILDWGDGASGDPATDLGQAWYMIGSELYDDCARAYRDAGGVGDPAAPRVRAEAIAYAVTMASLDDEHYAASGWRALEDLGVAERD
jgi:aminoglycoside phosphotransferase (APT) family kinase protein